MPSKGPIGIFDSGYGGLTVMKEIVKRLPQYDYMYLGDNARAPYGNRSFETVYRYTLQCVEWFFEEGCLLMTISILVIMRERRMETDRLILFTVTRSNV